jgi:hypothetical protein
MSFEQQWIEHDYNPFILFDSNGKIISLNTEAQFLLQHASLHEIYELATSYANITFGFKTTFMDLEFGTYSFFAIMVGYENEEQIGIKLYQKPQIKPTIPKSQGEITNIFTLIDLCIATNSINSNINFTKDFDPTIPEMMIEQNSFIKVLNKIYEIYLQNNNIKTTVCYKIGEYIKFENKKYPIVEITVSATKQDKTKLKSLEKIGTDTNLHLQINKKNITISIPVIYK